MRCSDGRIEVDGGSGVFERTNQPTLKTLRELTGVVSEWFDPMGHSLLYQLQGRSFLREGLGKTFLASTMAVFKREATEQSRYHSKPFGCPLGPGEYQSS
jgi:hypothetical protein